MPPLSGKRVIEEFDVEKSRRQNWESQWQDVADVVFPTRQFTTTHEPGTRVNRRIRDDTGPKAVITLANGLHGKLINPSTKWFSLVPLNEELLNDKVVMGWLDDTRNRILSFFANPESGFDLHMHEVFLDLAAFGTGALSIQETPLTLRFMARPLSQIYVRQDFETGQVTAVYRLVKINNRDAFDKWGTRAGADVARDAIAGGPKAAQRQEYIHVVAINTERNLSSPLSTDKAWISLYVRRDSGDIVDAGGFDENPFITPRWSLSPGEQYGRGPGIIALGSIRLANAIQLSNIRGAEKMVSPPLQVIANSLKGPINTGPSAINYVRDHSSRPSIMPINTGNNIPFGVEYLAIIQKQINEIFFLDLISPQENLARTNELAVQVKQQAQQQLLSPSLARINSELISPCIVRTFKKMRRRGEFLDPPAQLLDGSGALMGIDIAYNGPLAQAQKASELQSLLAWLNITREIAGVDPSAALYANVENIVVGSARDLGVASKFVRSTQEVQQIQQAQSQALAQQATLEAQNTAADTALKGAQAASELRATG